MFQSSLLGPETDGLLDVEASDVLKPAVLKVPFH